MMKNTTLGRLQVIASGSVEDDEARPTDYAFRNARGLIASAECSFVGRVSSDEQGAIRVRWINEALKREIRLHCGHKIDAQTYIYHESPESFDITFQVTPGSLANWLKWLDGGAVPA